VRDSSPQKLNASHQTATVAESTTATATAN
jgi:hypothetical protein